MTRRRMRRCGSNRTLLGSSLVAAALLLVPDLFATGYYGPEVYLSEGGRLVDASPEFYWELEAKRFAGDFHPSEKFVAPPSAQATQSTDETAPSMNEILLHATEEADDRDYERAISEGEIKPPNRDEAISRHREARAGIAMPSQTTLPDEFPSEFADYDRGAFSFRRGAEHYVEARAAWEALLNRPAAERRYRTLWAAFMLGKLALKTGSPEAVQWFEKTRALAKEGFVDSLGLAADSYGWEGRSEWKQDHAEKAAPLFLTQLALGDESAIVSLKALVPDREPVDGMLNYGPEPQEIAEQDDATKRAEEEKEKHALQRAAADPLLRRLVTLHILCTQAEPRFYEDTRKRTVARATRWLAIIQQAKLGAVEDAEYLGWLAYGDGKYDQAARWLALSKGDTAAALWLKAKLLRRAGKLNEALQAMAKAWETVRNVDAYTGWHSPVTGAEAERYVMQSEGGHWSLPKSAGGDLGGLHLARADFLESLDTLLKAGLWDDGAYVAERVLTTAELKDYIDRKTKPDASADSTDAKLRYLLGRRLVREVRYAEAAAYLKAPYEKVLEQYVTALNTGKNEKLSKEERARGWFTAAWIARFDGMELMGTEAAPDGFVSGGDFEEPDLAKERRSGVYTKVDYTSSGEKQLKLPVPLKPTKQELQRLTQNKISPDVRFHYRIIAGALAMRAAELLPDNAPETADVINRAGNWVKDRDEKLGNRYFAMLEQRAANTPIGKAAREKHWFVDEEGPWSSAQSAAHDAILKELNVERDSQ